MISNTAYEVSIAISVMASLVVFFGALVKRLESDWTTRQTLLVIVLGIPTIVIVTPWAAYVMTKLHPEVAPKRVEVVKIQSASAEGPEH